MLLGIIWYKYWSFHHPKAKSYTYHNTFLILCLFFIFKLFFFPSHFPYIFRLASASCYPLELTIYICTGIRLRRKSYVFIVFSFFRFSFRNLFIFLFIYFALSELNKPYLNNFHNSIFIVLEAASVCYVCIQFGCRNAGVQLGLKGSWGKERHQALQPLRICGAYTKYEKSRQCE